MNHDVLISKLEYYVVRGLPVKPLTHCVKIAGRTHCVKIRDGTSNCTPITSRALQGSVLQSYLFLVYVKDIHQSDSQASFHLFEDDTSLSFADKKTRSKG